MRIVTLPRAMRRHKQIAIVEALEDGIAKLEIDDAVRTVPRADLSPSAREGDVLVLRVHRWVRDEALTEARRQRIERRLQRLLRRPRPNAEPQ